MDTLWLLSSLWSIFLRKAAVAVGINNKSSLLQNVKLLVILSQTRFSVISLQWEVSN